MQKLIERYGVAICAGAVVTIGLLWIMQAVISTDENPLNEDLKYRNLEFVKLLDDIEPVREDINPDKPPDVDEMPPDLPEPDLSPDDGSAIGVDVSVRTDTVVIDADPGAFTADGEYEPIFKVEPVYPRRALQLELEGYVIVEFDVTETGSVENVTVVQAEPKGVFESAARRAAEKFRYRPKVVNEKAVRVSGVRNKITFELEDER